MQRTLLLMRHAKSDWKQPGLADHDRPLNARGRRAAPLMAHHLSDQGIRVDVILASTAERVRETIELMQQVWCEEVEVLPQKSLYLASPQEIASQIQSLHDSWQNVMLVGHNPGLSAAASLLAGIGQEMPTAAIAVFQAEIDSWARSFAANVWELKALWRPRELELEA